MDRVDVLERVCALGWPPVVGVPLGQWVLRASGGYTGRANSALACGDPGVSMVEALAEVERFAREHGIRPYAQVVVGAPVEAALAERGWAVNTAHAKGAEVVVLWSPPSAGEPRASVVRETASDAWIAIASGGSDSPAARAVLTSGPRVGFAEVVVDGVLAGVARGCVVGSWFAESWLYVSAVEVVPAFRRRGLALDLLSALDSWAGGATGRVLQVATDNAAALALYDRLGYRESHRYRYWLPANHF